MEETKTPTRDEIPEADKWDLSLLFADADKWNEDFAWIQANYPRLTNWKGRVGESAATLAELLEFEKTLDLKIERVYHFASLQLAEDSANPEYLARIGQLQNLLTSIGEAAAFLAPEIQAIDDETFAHFLDDPALADWRVNLHKIRRMKPHVLSEKEERLLALGSSALDGYDDTFSQLTNVDMKFGVLARREGRGAPADAKLFQLVPGEARSRRCGSARFTNSTRSFRITSSPSPRRSPIRSRPMSSARARAIIRPRSEASLFQGRRAGGGLRQSHRVGAAESRAALSLLRSAPARARARRAPRLRHLCAAGRRDRNATSPSMKRSRRCSPRSRRSAANMSTR